MVITHVSGQVYVWVRVFTRARVKTLAVIISERLWRQRITANKTLHIPTAFTFFSCCKSAKYNNHREANVFWVALNPS